MTQSNGFTGDPSTGADPAVGAPPPAGSETGAGAVPGADGNAGPTVEPPPGADGPPGADPAPTAGAGLGSTVAALTADDIDRGQRRQLLGRLVTQARRGGLGRLFRPKAAVAWMTDVVSDVTPYLPVRDLETLRQHHDGLDGEALADRLVRNAALATGGIGAAGGGIAAVEWVTPPTLLTAPVLLAAETVAVVAVELKLVGELHEVYGLPVAGNGAQRAVAMIQSWAGQRGVNPLVPGSSMAAVLGTAARKELGETLLRRFGRNLTTLGPMLTGAAVASVLNRRATMSLGERLRADLRRQQRPLEGLPNPRVIDHR